MMWKRILGYALLMTTSIGGSVGAQETQPRSREGAYAAAIALLQRNLREADSMRFAPDSTTMYRLFVRCEGPEPAPSTCALIDGKPVTMVLVDLKDSVTARVQARFYGMGWFCAGPPQLRDVLMIENTGMHEYTFAYADGQWKQSATSKGWIC